MPISVIIPTYNDSDELVKTIASCLVQDIMPEIIVVDDCSDKRISGTTREMVDSFCKHIRNWRNRGLAESRDEGISMATGQFILPLDTGDWLYPHVLGKMLKAIVGVDVVYGNMTEKDDGKIYVPPGNKGITVERMKTMNQLWCTSMFRKSIWEKVGGYTNGLHTSYEDYTFWNKCLVAGAKFKYVNETIYRHQHNPNSMLSKLHKETAFYNELARRPLYG